VAYARGRKVQVRKPTNPSSLDTLTGKATGSGACTRILEGGEGEDGESNVVAPVNVTVAGRKVRQIACCQESSPGSEWPSGEFEKRGIVRRGIFSII